MASSPGVPGNFLEGIRVLDFTQYLAGPSSTRLMAELGAEILKVEQPPFGDPMRATSPRRNRRSGAFIQQNRGKKGLCIDLSQPEGVALVKELVPHVDVIVENFTPGVMARRGLDYESLKEINPGIIMASVSGYGQTGALSSQSSFDFIAQAYSGVMHVTGDPDGPPTFVGTGLADTNSGVHAFAGIGYALFHKERTGIGTQVDISMVDALFHMHEMHVQAPSLTDGEYVPTRNGRHYGPVAPAGSFKGPDGWIVVLCGVNQIQNLWETMGQPELADDPRFATNETRAEYRDDLTEIMEAWMATFDSNDDLLAALKKGRVPAGPVLNPADAEHQQYYKDRQMVRQIEDPIAGSLNVPGFPIKYSAHDVEPDLVAPMMGEHNREVLSELLGYDDKVIDEWEASGLLGSKDR